jgi:hypothetical protein
MSLFVAAEDGVYMKDTDLLEEYILNDHGVQFQGSSNKIGAKIWNFAQVCCKYDNFAAFQMTFMILRMIESPVFCK